VRVVDDRFASTRLSTHSRFILPVRPRRFYRHTSSVVEGIRSFASPLTPRPVGVEGAGRVYHPRFGSGVSLTQCLKEHTSPETLAGAHARYCEFCEVILLHFDASTILLVHLSETPCLALLYQMNKDARKTIALWRDRLPEVTSSRHFALRAHTSCLPAVGARQVLIVLLKRHGDLKKETFVDFPIDGLDVAPYCAKVRRHLYGGVA